MERRFGGCRIEVLQGDLTDQVVDAVVNAANPGLRGGGGVDGAIHRRGGPEIAEACRRIREELGRRLKTGEAVITPGGGLPARHVIHTAGPVYGSTAHPAEKLADAYRNSLETARREGLSTVAFPSISTGAYGYPVVEAAHVALSTVRDWLAGTEAHGLELVRFVLWTEEDYAVYRRTLEAL